MNNILEAFIPRHANNDYQGGRIAFYGFIFLFMASLFRSTVHFLKDDSGVNSIAGIIVFEGNPNPNDVIYMFSAVMGLTQMMWTIMSALVLWRYRNLIPLMLAFLILEHLFVFVVGVLHPLNPAYFIHTPPGVAGAVPKLIITAILLILALRNTLKSQQADGH